MPAQIDPVRTAAIVASIRANITPEGPARSRNALAREHGVSPSTLSKIAQAHDLGDAFDRTITKRATEAAAADAMAEAARLAARLVAEAHALIDRMHSPHLVYNFGGRDNDYNEHTLDEPPADVQRQYVTMAAIAIDKVVKVHQAQSGGLVSEAAFDAFLAAIGGNDPGPPVDSGAPGE